MNLGQVNGKKAAGSNLLARKAMIYPHALNKGELGVKRLINGP
jgi:hypothetical protein